MIFNDFGVPMMPLGCIKSYRIAEAKTRKIFAITMGASTDFIVEGTQRMLVNAACWCLELKVP